MSLPWPTLGGSHETLETRPTSDGRRSHDSPEANLGRETQSQLICGQPWTSSAFSTRPRPSWVMLFKVSNSINQLCKALGERCSHDSPKVNLELETQAWLVRGQPRTSIVFFTRLRASRVTLWKVPNSAPTNSTSPRVGVAVKNRPTGDAITILARGQPRAEDAVTPRSRPTIAVRGFVL
jgi:hypothetical protein